MKRIGLTTLFILFMISTSHAIDDKAIAERIALLEAQKVQIEQAYIGIIARIEELKELLKLKEIGNESRTDSDKSRETVVK